MVIDHHMVGKGINMNKIIIILILIFLSCTEREKNCLFIEEIIFEAHSNYNDGKENLWRGFTNSFVIINYKGKIGRPKIKKIFLVKGNDTLFLKTPSVFKNEYLYCEIPFRDVNSKIVNKTDSSLSQVKNRFFSYSLYLNYEKNEKEIKDQLTYQDSTKIIFSYYDKTIIYNYGYGRK